VFICYWDPELRKINGEKSRGDHRGPTASRQNLCAKNIVGGKEELPRAHQTNRKGSKSRRKPTLHEKIGNKGTKRRIGFVKSQVAADGT